MNTSNDMYYVRLTKGLKTKGRLVDPSEVYDKVTDYDQDWYVSTYYYNEDQRDLFNEETINPKTGKTDVRGCRGIRDVVTNQIWLDFDSDDLEASRDDTDAAVHRLIHKYGVEESSIQIYYSGSKGFNVVVTLDRYLTPTQVRRIALEKIGRGNLSTLDDTLYDHTQVLRLPGTRHPKSGLYKIPLTKEDLEILTIDEIKEKATDPNSIEPFEWTTATPNDDFYNLEEEGKKETKTIEVELDLSRKPKHWKNCKWSLLQGNFDVGERHSAMMVIAATCKGLGYDQETTKAMCLTADAKHVSRTGDHPIEDLDENILPSIFTDEGWEGGQYTCQKDGWLKDYCETLGDKGCKDVQNDLNFKTQDMGDYFKQYAEGFEKNLIKTGIKEIDRNVKFMASTHNGILGNPGSGKTTFALDWLHNASRCGIKSLFLSLDMGVPLIYAKLIQRLKGCDFDTALKLYQDGSGEMDELDERINEEYKNVDFNFTSGMTVDNIKHLIQTNNKNEPDSPIKLLVIDYLECISGPYSDPIANSSIIANQLKDIANEFQLCSILLLQTQKHSTADVSDPLLSIKNVKGSSIIEQSCTVIMTLWRDGYNPETVENDKYISFAVVKNRLGPLWKDDFGWDGKSGKIVSLTYEEKEELKEFRREKRRLKREKEDGEGW